VRVGVTADAVAKGLVKSAVDRAGLRGAVVAGASQ
jgi:hypothetical protein